MTSKRGGNAVWIDQQEFNQALKSFADMRNALEPRYMKNVQARVARRTIIPAMKARSKSARLDKMISVTTAKRRSGDLGIKVGVVKNDTSLFPKFSAPALASVIEYGTAERYRTLKRFGLVTGQQSTGEMPEAPFLRPGWDSTVSQFMREVEDALEKKVMKEV